jgi:tetratricopeptide (TPR) repeat protein
MKRTLILVLLITLSQFASGQKSRVLAIFQMIDQGTYSEAKEEVELAVWNDRTSRWPRTYYAKGLLCQTAYEEGYEKKDPKLTGLYPDQLYVAYRAYERALELDVRNRLHQAITQKYYHLSNDFRILGQAHFSRQEYQEAFRAFEHSLMVANSKLVHAKLDTGLVFNTALAALEARNWSKAIVYLTGLHKAAHSPAASLLLYQAHMENGDSIRAEEVLLEGVKLYQYEEQVVLYLVDLFVTTNRMKMAISLLNDAIATRPDHYRFLWSRGLVYRRMGMLDQAIEDFKAALLLAPGEARIYDHLGLIYYNMGIDLSESSLGIEDNKEYQKVRAQSREKLLEAVRWLEKSYELDPTNENTIFRLHQLYNQLQMKEKEESMKLLIE